jgi:tetratricopeptide (TPR) repeat protein
MGDVLFRTKRNEAAAEWYAKAVQIDPDRETADRYWGDALDSSGKMEEARDKFIEAVVAEPYTRQSWIGLSQWAGRYHYRLGRPVVNLPAPSVDDKGHITINFNPANKKDDGSEADLLYSMTRSLWRGEKFEKAFPGVKTYRHSLAEEIDALTITTDSLLELKNKEDRERLRPDLKLLLQIRSEGLLEPFVLLSMADEGIAQDYGAYRESHRNELKEFLQRFFLSEK